MLMHAPLHPLTHLLALRDECLAQVDVPVRLEKLRRPLAGGRRGGSFGVPGGRGGAKKKCPSSQGGWREGNGGLVACCNNNKNKNINNNNNYKNDKNDCYKLVLLLQMGVLLAEGGTYSLPPALLSDARSSLSPMK